MSNYSILFEDPNLEVSLGFDQGLEGYFLTIGDHRTCTGESGSYLFHNLDHHPGMRMSLSEVREVMESFGLELPQNLELQLRLDGLRHGVLEPANVVKMGSTGRRSTPLDGFTSTRIVNWGRL